MQMETITKIGIANNKNVWVFSLINLAPYNIWFTYIFCCWLDPANSPA